MFHISKNKYSNEMFNKIGSFFLIFITEKKKMNLI